jgi:hypothetical protein
MRFEYYHPGLDSVPKLSVDGTVDNSIHFSHWRGNTTPAELKADTSTEIALNLVAAANMRELTHGIELVTNNHFDTDGVLSVWTVLNGSRALDLKGKLIAAAETGDFSEFTNEAAIRASIAVQGSDQPSLEDKPGSPLACQLAGKLVGEDEAYNYVLPEVERLLTNTDAYESLWRDGWTRLATAIESFERRASHVTEYPEQKLSLITLAPEAFDAGGFDPARHGAPFTAISRYAKGKLFLISIPYNNGWAYRVDYPYYSWAETVVRPQIARHDFSDLLVELNHLEKATDGMWQSDSSELSSAVKFSDQSKHLTASSLSPDSVAEKIVAYVSANATTAAIA